MGESGKPGSSVGLRISPLDCEYDDEPPLGIEVEKNTPVSDAPAIAAVRSTKLFEITGVWLDAEFAENIIDASSVVGRSTPKAPRRGASDYQAPFHASIDRGRRSLLGRMPLGLRLW